ncbi:hypothetical protein OEZ85_003368 [Tetradesmus obliquus]|uniref:Ubiquitin-like domain-containing protein n=1 Tax=Tetradesmus obliquus TaxID=3088 RepID=A0ABY8UC45_TETOB|nr:hypothetical protein OEZ85_003368 [Tetradesmus obliquus]
MPLPVLLRSQTDRQLLNTALDPAISTAAELKAEVAQFQGLPASCVTQVSWQGEELQDRQTLREAGLSSCIANVQAAGCQLFPNNWFQSSPAKTYTKVLDITWPPLRQADYAISIAWLAAALAALAAANTLLGS